MSIAYAFFGYLAIQASLLGADSWHARDGADRTLRFFYPLSAPAAIFGRLSNDLEVRARCMRIQPLPSATECWAFFIFYSPTMQPGKYGRMFSVEQGDRYFDNYSDEELLQSMTEDEYLSCRNTSGMLRFLKASGVSYRKILLFCLACCRHVWHLMDEEAREALEELDRAADEGLNTISLGVMCRCMAKAAERGEEYIKARRDGRELGSILAIRCADDAVSTLCWRVVGWDEQTPVRPNPSPGSHPLPFSCVYYVCSALGRKPDAHDSAWLPGLLRSIVRYPAANLPRPPMTEDILRLARHAYVSANGVMDQSCLLVLSDALEEAGCPTAVPCRYGNGYGYDHASCEGCDRQGNAPHPLLVHLRSLGPHYRGDDAIDLLLGKS